MSRQFTEVVETKIWHPTLLKFISQEEFTALQAAVNLDKEIEEAEKVAQQNRRDKIARGQSRSTSSKNGEDANMPTLKAKTNEKMKKAVAAKTAPKKDVRIITAIVKENPYREGSKGAKKFAVILKAGKSGISVADYFKAGGQSSDLGWGKDHNFLKVN